MPDNFLIGAAATIAAVVVGGGMQALQQRSVQRAQRSQLAADRLWSARREAYTEFLIAFNDAAHVAGSLAPRPGRSVPSGDEAREVADYHFDRTVTPARRALELVATADARRLAGDATDALGRFRDRMTHPELPAPQYRSEEYEAAYQPAREARRRFEIQAVEDLKAL